MSKIVIADCAGLVPEILADDLKNHSSNAYTMSPIMALVRAFQVKGGHDSNNPLKTKEKHLPLSVKKVTGLPARWSETDDRTKLRFILVGLQEGGAKRLHLDLSQDVQDEVRNKGLDPFYRRLSVTFKRTLGFVPGFVVALDIDQGRLHSHGAIEVTDNTEPTIKRALRQAGGLWEGPVGNRRQLVLNELDRPDWCANYMIKMHDHPDLMSIPGPLWCAPNAVRRAAATIHAQGRYDCL
jgi:hypothetical protein